jgi:hypothetical protein
MSVSTVLAIQTNKSAIKSEAQSNWKGREVTDQTYLAGAGPEMFNGLGRGIITAGILFAALVATVAVGIVTGSLQSAFITGGVISGGAVIVNLFLSARSPRL